MHAQPPTQRHTDISRHTHTHTYDCTLARTHTCPHNHPPRHPEQHIQYTFTLDTTHPRTHTHTHKIGADIHNVYANTHAHALTHRWCFLIPHSNGRNDACAAYVSRTVVLQRMWVKRRKTSRTPRCGRRRVGWIPPLCPPFPILVAWPTTFR
jgi:hypothetical protein